MPVNERSIKNLKPPVKGEVRNPTGKGAGVLSSKTIIRKWLEAAEKAKNPISGQEENLTQLDIITLKQLEKARKGDTMAFRELLDRMEGKANQSIDVSSLGESVAPKKELTKEQIDKLIDKF